jgi:non-specific serine/threonine protein kinase
MVTTLIAEGLTNREIASVLTITERTAETHVQHIFNKLGLNSRTQVAAWIVKHGLQATSADETPRMAPPQESHRLRP